MKRHLLGIVLSSAVLMGTCAAQRSIQPLPKEVFAARTVAIVNNTHNEAVEQSAVDALKRWGRFTVIDDSDLADITLTFDKRSEHDGSSSQTTGDDGKPSSSYSVSFSSSVHMTAVAKGAGRSFYATTTSESKKKAGAECVTDLQSAFVSGR
jgi:hypothetical protein